MNQSFSEMAPHLACPSGTFGKEVGKFMDRINDPQNDWVLTLLNLQPTDKVLEIGFGTGRTIKKALKRVTQGHVDGIEISDTMLEEASKLLQQEISNGKVKLMKNNAELLPFTDNSIDKTYAVHVIYFWKDIDKVIAQFYRVNKPGGITAIYFVSPILKPSPYFHEYSEEEISKALKKSGFSKVEISRKKFDHQNGICILAKK